MTGAPEILCTDIISRAPEVLKEWRRGLYADTFEAVLPENFKALQSYLPFLGAATQGEVVTMVHNRCAINLEVL